MPVDVIHIGPHMETVGGTQSVIRTIADNSIGADRIRVRPTWEGGAHRVSLRHMRAAAGTIVRAARQTILHAHVSTGGAWLREGTLVALARIRGLRSVVHIHGHDFPEFSGAHPTLVGAVLRLSDHIICLSEEARHSVRALAPEHPVTLVANPMAIDEHAPPVESVSPVVLFAGPIGIRKGVDVLIQAWRILLEQDAPGRCRIVGEVADYSPPKLDRLTVENAVHPTEMRRLVREARVVVLPSRAEGMPMILTEALASARPFVATGVGGTRTLTQDPAMIVPVNDAKALAGAVGAYLRDAGLAGRAGRRGQEHVRRTRSPEVIDAQLRQVYMSLGRRGSRQPAFTT